MNWCILIILGAGASGAILGYFLGKRSSSSNHEKCDDRIRRLENSLEASKKAKNKLDIEIKTLKQLV